MSKKDQEDILEQLQKDIKQQVEKNEQKKIASIQKKTKEFSELLKNKQDEEREYEINLAKKCLYESKAQLKDDLLLPSREFPYFFAEPLFSWLDVLVEFLHDRSILKRFTQYYRAKRRLAETSRPISKKD